MNDAVDDVTALPCAATFREKKKKIRLLLTDKRNPIFGCCCKFANYLYIPKPGVKCLHQTDDFVVSTVCNLKREKKNRAKRCCPAFGCAMHNRVCCLACA